MFNRDKDNPNCHLNVEYNANILIEGIVKRKGKGGEGSV